MSKLVMPHSGNAYSIQRIASLFTHGLQCDSGRLQGFRLVKTEEFGVFVNLDVSLCMEETEADFQADF